MKRQFVRKNEKVAAFKYMSVFSSPGEKKPGKKPGKKKTTEHKTSKENKRMINKKETKD